MNELSDQDGPGGRDLALLIDEKEAASGFEPEMMDLQSTALPLGYAALVPVFRYDRPPETSF